MEGHVFIIGTKSSGINCGMKSYRGPMKAAYIAIGVPISGQDIMMWEAMKRSFQVLFTAEVRKRFASGPPREWLSPP